MVDYVEANYSLPADHDAMFDPEKWQAEMQSADSSSTISIPDGDASQDCHDDADNETHAVIRNQDRDAPSPAISINTNSDNDNSFLKNSSLKKKPASKRCDNNVDDVDISSSPSHSGGLSDNDVEKSKPMKDPYAFKESPMQSVAGPSGSGQSKSQESILSMFPRSKKSSNLSFSKRKRQSCDEDGADEGKKHKSSGERKRFRSGDKVKDTKITIDEDDNDGMETMMSMTSKEQDNVSQEVNGDKEQHDVTLKINDGHDGAPGSLKVRLNVGPKKRGRPRKTVATGTAALSAESARRMRERSLQKQEDQKRSVDAMLKNMQPKPKPSKTTSHADKKGAGPGHVGKLSQDVGSTHLVPTSSSGEKKSEEKKVKSTSTNRKKKVKEPKLPRKTISGRLLGPHKPRSLPSTSNSSTDTIGKPRKTLPGGSSIKANKKHRAFAETSTSSSSTDTIEPNEEVNVSVNDSADSLLKELSVDANNPNLDVGGGGDESDDTLPFSPGEAERDKDLEEEEQDTTNESRDSAGRRSYEVERIVDRKIVSKGGKKVTMYKVRWLGWGPDDDQWLTSDRLNCPELVAEFDRAIDTTNEDEET